MYEVISRQEAEQAAWQATPRHHRGINEDGERCLMTRDEYSLWASQLVRLMSDEHLTRIIGNNTYIKRN